MLGRKSFLRETLVDLKNGLPPRRFADHFHERGVVFVHVPKCGGTSVENGLRAAFRLSRYIVQPETSFEAACAELGVSPNDTTRHDILNRASEMRRTMLHLGLATGYKCITGHAPLGERTLEKWRQTHDFVTVLRDPVKRFVSHLSFNLNGGGGHGRIDETVEQFLERPRAKTMGALYIKYFAGVPMDADMSAQHLVGHAKRNIDKMEAVGFTDNLADFADDMTVLTGHKINIGHDNKTGKGATPRPEKINFDAEIMSRIEELCALDKEIYDWARANFYTSVTGDV